MQGNRETDKQKHTETGDVEESDTDKQDEEKSDRLAKKGRMKTRGQTDKYEKVETDKQTKKQTITSIERYMHTNKRRRRQTHERDIHYSRRIREQKEMMIRRKMT